jgi:DNA-directed RNA polymerase sigma subunit (sigma70/sigma32)
MSSINTNRNHADKTEPMFSEWETCIKKLAYFKLAYLVESALEVQRHHSSAADLSCLRQLAASELWDLIENSLKLPSDFELKARRAIESRIKDFKRASQKESRLIETLKVVQDGVQLPSDELESQEMQEIFDDALQGLTHEQIKTLALLHGLGDCDSKKIAEVAALEKVSTQTIRYRERKAYSLLRQNKEIRSLVS